MTPERYRELLQEIGLTQNAASRFFDVRDETARDWARGKDIPASVAMLLEIMALFDITPEEATTYGTGEIK
jgi:NOL1/NOP2/fmu family ribosome biogenesis protein